MLGTLSTVMFTTGFGLGMSCAEAGPMLAEAAPIPIYRQCPINHGQANIIESRPDPDDHKPPPTVLIDHSADNSNKNQ